MKKNICWVLFILSMVLYTDFFIFHLSSRESTFLFYPSKTVLFANICLFLMIFLVHNFFYPKNITDHAQVISYPPMIMLFLANLSVLLEILKVGIVINYVNFFADILNLINLPVFDILGINIFGQNSGLFFMFLSIIIISLAIKQFANIEEDPNPTTSSKSIIAIGIYNWTRNPMYLGLVFFHFGLGLALRAPPITSFSLLTLIIFNYFVIKREEEYLERKFGNTYLVYKKKVRRWL